MKNLLLVFALVSLFSCKKETIAPIDNEVNECVSVDKVFKGFLTQVNEDNPTISILENSIGEISAYRVSSGLYKIYIEGLNESTVIVYGGVEFEDYYIDYSYDYLVLSTNNMDNQLINTPIEIRVYD